MSDLRELLTEIRDHLRNLDTLAQRREKDRERKRLVRGQTTCPRTKEEEKGKETFPPAPPIEKRAKEEESSTSCAGDRACVRAHEAKLLPPVIDVRSPPSLELLLAFAHLRCGFYDDVFTREWYRVMSDELMWCYPDSGTPIQHWPAYFRLWRVKRPLFDKINDPDRIPDARAFVNGRRADNWRGTRKEDIGDALG